MNEITDLQLLTDEQGEEYAGLVALVIGDKVELCPLVRKRETGPSVDDRAEALYARFGSHPSDQKYLGVVRLYRTGKARPSLEGRTSSVFERQGRRLALQAAEDLYDRVWPDVAESYRQFVHNAVAHINSRDSVSYSSHVRQAVVSGAIEPFIQYTSMADLLQKLLFEEEKDLLANVAISEKTGFVTEHGAAIMIVAVPYEKYRFGRAVAEIARKVNARKSILIRAGFLGDPETGETSDQACLWGLVIRPDGSIEVSGIGVYTRDNGRVRVKQGIKIADPSLDTQDLIPGWQLAAKANAVN